MLVLALFWAQKPWEWRGFLGGVRKEEFVCKAGSYTTEIISIDPLLIYINNFVDEGEIRDLIAEGCVLFLSSHCPSPNSSKQRLTEVSSRAPNLEKSEVYLHGSKRPSEERTSSSAGLSPSSPLVQCILSRAQSFMGSFFPPGGDFGTPQLVHYEKGEKFDVHHDWYEDPQPLRGKQGRWFNRVASFFVYLEGDCRGGETWFPYIDVKGEGKGKWEEDKQEGGTKFLPRRGNALFWVNLHGNGTGDERTVHAGLPLLEGRKTAMNIWPRKFYGRGVR